MTAQEPTTPVEFVEIPQAPGYDAGTDGHIYSRRTKGRVGLRDERRRLAEKVDKYGYREVTIYFGDHRKSFKVHTLVLQAFKGPCPPGMMACHYPDHDRSNNRPDNLMWGTNSTNQIHRREQGTAAAGERNHKAKLIAADVAEIRRIYEARGATQQQLAAYYGVTASTIGRIVRGSIWCDGRPIRDFTSRCGPRRKRRPNLLF